MTAKHTPGPWVVDGEGITVGTACSHEHGVCQEITAPCVARGSTIPETAAQANAQLIASAPDLFAVVNTVAHWQPTVEPEQAATSALDRAIYAARAALEGR